MTALIFTCQTFVMSFAKKVFPWIQGTSLIQRQPVQSQESNGAA